MAYTAYMAVAETVCRELVCNETVGKVLAWPHAPRMQ